MAYPQHAYIRGAETMRRQAHQAYAQVRQQIAELHAQGLSCKQIAEALNEMGHRTRRGLPFRAMQVWRVLRLYPTEREGNVHVPPEQHDPGTL